MRAAIALLALLLPSLAAADTFEIQGGYRASEHADWKGGEFTIHYLGEDWNDISFGAYFASSFWNIPDNNSAQTIEGGPEARWEKELGTYSTFVGLQYALLSSGQISLKMKEVGARIEGPRIHAGFVLPMESGFILNLGLSKGFEKLQIRGDSHDSEAFESYSAFVALAL